MRFALVAAAILAAGSLCACNSQPSSDFTTTGGQESTTGATGGGSATTGSAGGGSTSGAASGAAAGTSTGTSGGSSTGSHSSAGSSGAAASSSAGASSGAGGSGSGSTSSGSSGGSSSGVSSASSSSSGGASTSGGSSGGLSCPAGYTAATANGHPICKSSSGIPLFSHVFVIMMENTSASSLSASATPYLDGAGGLAATWATSSNYAGVTDPSLPNYIALTSGSTQSIGCDCEPAGSSSCDLSFCSNLLFNNDCNCGGMTVAHLGDQLDAATVAWREYGESMGTACNTTDNSPYAARHLPFLYYADVQSNATYCANHVVDYTGFAADLSAGATVFSIISPNLNDDMHGTGTFGQAASDVTNGDTWLSNNVPAILASPAFTDGGILFIVWDEGTDSLTPNGIPFYVLSPLAKQAGYVSSTSYDHYSLLATIEDGLDLGSRLGNAAGLAPLADFFPAN